MSLGHDCGRVRWGRFNATRPSTRGIHRRRGRPRGLNQFTPDARLPKLAQSRLASYTYLGIPSPKQIISHCTLEIRFVLIYDFNFINCALPCYSSSLRVSLCWTAFCNKRRMDHCWRCSRVLEKLVKFTIPDAAQAQRPTIRLGALLKK